MRASLGPLKGLGLGPFKGPLGPCKSLGSGPGGPPLGPKGTQGYAVPFSKYDPFHISKPLLNGTWTCGYLMCFTVPKQKSSLGWLPKSAQIRWKQLHLDHMDDGSDDDGENGSND